MIDGTSKYLLAGAGAAASLPRHCLPPSFVPPPARLSLETTEDAAAAVWKELVPNRSFPNRSFPNRSFPNGSFPNRPLVSSWLAFDRRDDKPQQPANTKTLHAPLESFEALANATSWTEEEGRRAAAAAAVRLFGTGQGLLCLERAIPDEVLRGLGLLADAAAPFKAETLHCSGGGCEEEWLDTLTDPFFVTASKNIPALRFSQNNGPQEEQEGGGAGEWRRADPSRKRLSSPNDELEVGEMRESENNMEALRWLKADVKRIARIFAREISSDPRCGGFNAGMGEGEEQERIDVTAKLELLRKGKCPRFHLDKVPLRLICTYVGPTTEWLDGYDTWEMEHNRSLPPACNAAISGGREARHARAGDVLIFRGQEEGQDEVGVAHRSPDMVEGQRRLVLTMDVGDIIAASSAS